MNDGAENTIRFAEKAKGKNPSAAAEIVKEAIAHPQTFVFGELLDAPEIAALEKEKGFEKVYETLKLFTYGQYLDYKQKKDKLLPLTPEALSKLKVLTLLTLCRSAKFVPYDEIIRATEITDIAQVEKLIIDSIYLNVLRGRMDQQKRRLNVDERISRDVALEDLPQMEKIIGSYLGELNNAGDRLREQLQVIQEKLSEDMLHDEKIEMKVTEKKKKINAAKANRSSSEKQNFINDDFDDM
ncbi:MAG: putative COP9 signalosome complex subunit 7a [Streblomastix strix]|uniref:Putative COP9 signalosome complex subunit 7a n=1 Tax=Streblomastix strix TaxID=222440 RepID=A0A5J4UBR5_9EUKA|nr:MAG: putative COP9 signalosome complex subunit 7a [Streblomastix strix]